MAVIDWPTTRLHPPEPRVRQGAHRRPGPRTRHVLGHRATTTFDPMGNRLTKMVGGATTTSTYNAANELTLVTPPTGPATTLTHDAAGNVTVEQVGATATTYTWDGENRLTQVDGPGGTEEYAYDAEGLRVRKETAAGTVHYVLDGANVLIETDGSLVTQAVYTDVPGEWGRKFPLRRAGASRFYLPDHQGHNRQLTDAGGDVTDTLLCDAWGVQVAASGGTVNPFALFGQWGYYRDTPERLLGVTDWWRPEQAVWMGSAVLLRAGGPVAPAPPKGLPEMPRIVVPDTPGRDGRNGGGSRVGSPRPGIGIDPWPAARWCLRWCARPAGFVLMLCAAQPAGPSVEFPPFPTRPKPRCDKDAVDDWRRKYCSDADRSKFHDCVSKPKKRRGTDEVRSGRGVTNPDICIRFDPNDGAWRKDTQEWIGWVLRDCCKKLTGKLPS